LGLASQGPDSTALDSDPFQRTIEDAISDLETDDETDWTFLSDAVEDLRKRPLDLNTAPREDLLLLPGMSELLVNSLQEHIAKFGPLTSMYELQAIPGFTREVYDNIRPFVTVRDVKEKDMRNGVVHPAGPPISDVLSDSRHELTTRFTRILEKEKGYTPPDTNSDGSLTSRYLGSPWRAYTRYRMRYNQNFSFALVGEKDQGEQFVWDPNKQFYGFDFVSGHVFIKNYGAIKRLVVGDYNLQIGQGLILSSGLGFGKGGEAVSAIKRSSIGIKPFSSVNENQFLRGAAGTVAWRQFYLTGFFSRQRLDANISQQDTLTDAVEFVSTLQTAGTHRTQSELDNKDALGETIGGGRLEFKARRLSIGTTHFVRQLDATQVPNPSDYTYFDFAGNRNFLSGIDYDFTWRNLNFFGEAARSSSGGTALTAGMLASLDRRVDFSILVRNFEKDFHSTRGYAFAERPVNLRNERGVYMGIKIMPNPKWIASAFLDQYWFPWNKYQVSYPSSGLEYLAQVEFKPERNTSIYLRWRSDTKQINDATLVDGQKIESLVPQQRQSLRVHFSHKLSRNLSLKSRAEFAWYNKDDEPTQKGLLLYQDVAWKMGWKWELTGRYALFQADDYDARIYAYENDVLGFYSIPAYYGRGSRFYLILNYRPKKWLEFWVRVAQTQYAHDDVIGSGLTEIQADHRTELKLQMRLSF
jgi:hypothetical protein